MHEKDELPDFPCDQCGLCCINAGLYGLPTKGESLRCLFLEDDNSCSNFDKRPPQCRVNELYKITNQRTSIEAWHKLNQDHCNKLKKENKKNEDTK